MPLTTKGKKILKSMEKTYGKKKAEEVFYASINKRKISGVEEIDNKLGRNKPDKKRSDVKKGKGKK